MFVRVTVSPRLSHLTRLSRRTNKKGTPWPKPRGSGRGVLPLGELAELLLRRPDSIAVLGSLRGFDVDPETLERLGRRVLQHEDFVGAGLRVEDGCTHW